MAKKKKCTCDEPQKDHYSRAFIAYQSSNSLTPGQMHCWQEFIVNLENEGVLPYVVFQVGTPPCVPLPGKPPCK